MKPLILPYPPTMNLMWRKTRNGRTYLTHEARHYKANTALLARAHGLRPIDGEVSLTINLYRPARRGDLDNSLKVMIDALKGVAFSDDSQVRRIEAERFEDKANPRVEVVVSAAPRGGDGRGGQV